MSEISASRAEGQRDRAVWSVAGLNAAALVGVANIIANVSNPDQALRTLLGPAWLFVLGALSAGIGALLHGATLAMEAEISSRLASLGYAIQEGELASDASHERGTMILQLIAKKPAAFGDAEGAEEFELALDHFKIEQKALEARWRVRKRWTERVLGVGLVCFLLAFVLISWNAYFGPRLAPPASEKAPVECKVQLPPPPKAHAPGARPTSTAASS